MSVSDVTLNYEDLDIFIFWNNRLNNFSIIIVHVVSEHNNASSMAGGEPAGGSQMRRVW